ncbi:MAG: DNA mismatch repair protein MutS [bacterium]|nr:DNA mismatch repair protein MutS [bacterium]
MAAKKKTRTGKTASAPKDPLDTPFMRQFLEIKKQYPDSILFFRMGDFYELFLEDAQIAAPIMDVALTKRQNEIPMAGVPYHSSETYLARLLAAGKRVAIAEQEADPENPKLMRRRVRRVMTPATLVEESLLEGAGHNYLMSVVPGDDRIGLAFCDVSTGDFFCQEVELDRQDDGEGAADAALRTILRDYYFKYAPREILCPTESLKRVRAIFAHVEQACVPIEDWKSSPTEGRRQIEQKFKSNLKGLGFSEDAAYALGAVSLVIHYVSYNFPGDDVRLSSPVYREVRSRYMLLDEQTIRNLDLLHNTQEGGTSRTLYGVLDRCHTPVGKRYLREALLAPLLDSGEIQERLDLVENLAGDRGLRESLSGELKKVYDLERVLSRMATGRGQPRDFGSLRATVAAGGALQKLFQEHGRGGLSAGTKNAKGTKKAETAKDAAASGELISVGKELQDLAAHMQATVVDEPPAVLNNAPFVRDGVDEELDRAREASQRGSRWVAEFETAEREKTGITALRVKYNKIHGYFIEISKGQADQAPADYRRRQTLVGYERFTSERLEELQTTLLEADEIIARVEGRIFQDLCAIFLEQGDRIKELMHSIARIDFLLSLASQAVRHGWTRPILDSEGGLSIEAGRHPVVEEYLDSGEQFIPNDVHLDERERSFAVITGPNMAGKSTYIRQLGLIQLLSQVGSFVPARSARLPVADRIFTRIGAQDNLTRGESTFFVEMLEAARILNQCTERSLVIMDEVGRGTSTYDGISLAWAIVEYLSDPEGPRPLTVFATHYHELTALSEREGIFNLTMDVQERDGQVIFLHRVREGAADRSYGIHVARLAGLPETVLARAEQKLAELEQDLERDREDTRRKSKHSRKAGARGEQTMLF